MKFGSVTKLDKRSKKPSKIDDDVVPANCDVIFYFSDLCSIWNNAEAGFRTLILQNLHFQ